MGSSSVTGNDSGLVMGIDSGPGSLMSMQWGTALCLQQGAATGVEQGAVSGIWHSHGLEEWWWDKLGAWCQFRHGLRRGLRCGLRLSLPLRHWRKVGSSGHILCHWGKLWSGCLFPHHSGAPQFITPCRPVSGIQCCKPPTWPAETPLMQPTQSTCRGSSCFLLLTLIEPQQHDKRIFVEFWRHSSSSTMSCSAHLCAGPVSQQHTLQNEAVRWWLHFFIGVWAINVCPLQKAMRHLDQSSPLFLCCVHDCRLFCHVMTVCIWKHAGKGADVEVNDLFTVNTNQKTKTNAWQIHKQCRISVCLPPRISILNGHKKNYNIKTLLLSSALEKIYNEDIF